MFYRDIVVCEHRLDIVVEDTVVLELKAVREITDCMLATVRSYLRASNLPVGLVLNFSLRMLDKRRVRPGRRA